MYELKNLNSLTKSVKDVIEPYCHKMLNLHGDNIKSLYVYGSAASDEFIPKKSNINILVILRRIDPPDLKKTLGLVKSGFKKGILAPLMLTLEHIRSSTDAFPIEFLEFKENNVLVYGEDILSSLAIKHDNIRLQCEQQIKGGLVRLYQAYLETGFKEKETMGLMIRSITSLMPIFRSLLRLKGKSPSTKKRSVISDMCTELSISSDVLNKVLDLKEGKKIPDKIETLFGDYMEKIEELGIKVDQM
jgi:predicted nucleotidyltransferase